MSSPVAPIGLCALLVAAEFIVDRLHHHEGLGVEAGEVVDQAAADVARHRGRVNAHGQKDQDVDGCRLHYGGVDFKQLSHCK